jgi:pimeloyl-ACP methyl ester carboxylesterase
VIERLAGEFDVLACDTPGFGASPPLPEGIERTMPSFVEAFEWFFAELGLERPPVAGNSMGGAIALELARRRAVSSASAFSPAGGWSYAERRFCQLSLGGIGLIPPAARPAVTALARTRPGRYALFSQNFAFPRAPAGGGGGRDPARLLGVSLALRDAAGILRLPLEAPQQLRGVPVTIAWGIHDRLLPYRLQAPRARALLPWATTTLGAGHVPFYDDPAAAAEVVRVRAPRRRHAGPVA